MSLVAVVMLSLVPALMAPTIASAAPSEDSSVRVHTRLDGSRFKVTCVASFSADALNFGQWMGYDTVQLESSTQPLESTQQPPGNTLRPLNCTYVNRVGEPTLPAVTMRIALPEGMTVTRARLGATDFGELPGTHHILPAQPPRPIADFVEPVAFVEPNPDVYTSSTAYPAKRVEFVQQTDLAGQSVAVLRLHPLQYVPATGKLTLATSIEIVLEGVPGHICGDYLPRSA